MTSPDSPDGEAPAEPGAPDTPADLVASESGPGGAAKPWKPPKRRRSWAQRSLLALNCLVIIACFAGAGALLVARAARNGIPSVELAAPPDATTVGGQPDGGDDGGDDPGQAPVDTSDATPTDTGPVETFPVADPEAKNFLITGADNNSCLDPNSPYAAAFGDRESLGERSDTIMLMRVDPESHKAAVLSFPRDLWVKIDGGGKSRINSAYVRDQPQKLINTLYLNFGLPVDHFIQVDFCAFKVMVDAVGGVKVPFQYPARDTHTGLNVPEPGCFTFDGEHALAYVRSRHYQYMDDSGKWKTDGTSDLGRISRQQDFLRRILSSALAKGWNLGVARDMISAAQDYVVLDDDLTLSRMLQFAGLLSDFDPGEITTYQIESKGQTINGNAVLIPQIDSDNMQAILLMFRGGIPLADAPPQFTGTTTETAPPTSISTETTVTPQTVPGVVPPDEAC